MTRTEQPPYTDDELATLALTWRRLDRRTRTAWIAWGTYSGDSDAEDRRLKAAHQRARDKASGAAQRLHKALDEQIAWENAGDPIGPETHDFEGRS